MAARGNIARPERPVIANGVVFTVGADGPSGSAVLHALDALTGAEIYSSGAVGAFTSLGYRPGYCKRYASTSRPKTERSGPSASP